VEVIYSDITPFQHIMIYRKGALVELILDGYPQSALPNNEYYEMMLGPNHGWSTLILGGGDLTAVEVLVRHGITDWKMVEIDEMVVNACERFCPRRRNVWGKNVIIGDAFAYLRECAPVEHIVVDLLAMSRFDALESGITIEEFIKLLAEKSTKYVSGFIDAMSYGTATGLVLQRAFERAGFVDFQILVNELGEHFFWAGHVPIELPTKMSKYVIRYGVAFRDDAIYDFTLAEQLMIVHEGL